MSQATANARVRAQLVQRLVDATQRLIGLLELNIGPPRASDPETVVGIPKVLTEEFYETWKAASVAQRRVRENCKDSSAADTIHAFIATVVREQPWWNGFNRNEVVPGHTFRFRDIKYTLVNVPFNIVRAKRACELLKSQDTKSRRSRGRPRKTTKDKVDKVVAKIVKRGEHEAAKWGDLVREYADELPAHYTSGALSKRVKRYIVRQADSRSLTNAS